MHTKNILRLLPFLLAAFAFAFALALPLLAQASPTPAPVAADSTAATVVPIALALISGLFGIWQNKRATTARKITDTLVLAVEQATQLPEVKAQEQRIKATIRQKATRAGVQPVLHAIVRKLT